VRRFPLFVYRYPVGSFFLFCHLGSSFLSKISRRPDSTDLFPSPSCIVTHPPAPTLPGLLICFRLRRNSVTSWTQQAQAELNRYSVQGVYVLPPSPLLRATSSFSAFAFYFKDRVLFFGNYISLALREMS